jgi:hypothetical protein
MQITPPRASQLRARDRLALDTGSYRRSTVSADVRDARDAHVGRARVGGSRILRLRAWLAQPSAAWVIIAAALFLCAPALVTGIVLDDNFHAVALRSELSTPGTKRAPWDAFSFATTAANNRQLVDEGIFPWWSDLNARLAFFRPLASLTLWVDQNIWPDAPALMHMQSFLWYGLLLTVVAGIYRRFSARAFSFGFAGLALLLFAVDDAHAMTVGWIANRSALMALTFGFASLLAHDRWRTTSLKRHLLGELVLMALGLLCAEAAFQVTAYFVAYAVFLDRGSKRSRWRSLIPYAGLLFVWHSLYSMLGFGAAGSEMYIDPAHDPIAFIKATAVRLPLLLAAQFGGLSADLGDWLRYWAPSLSSWLLPLTLTIVAVAAWTFYPLWATRREVRFWAVGSLFSTVPVCAAMPADRLLMATGVGGSALVAILILAALDRVRELRSRTRSVFVWTMAIVNVAVAPLLLPVQAYALVYMDRYIDKAERTLPDGESIPSKTVVLLNPPTDEYGIYMLHHRRLRGAVMPKHLRWLASSASDLTLTRVDAYTVKVTPHGGFLPEGAFWTLRTRSYKSKVGDSVQLEGATYTVTAVTDDGRPAELSARFDKPIESDGFIWMRWSQKKGFVPFALPQPGQSMFVPAVTMDSVFVEEAS